MLRCLCESKNQRAEDKIMATAIDVANWIIRYRAEDIGAPIDPMSLEKHVFYAQCFFLALNGEALFLEEVEAWRNGPVIPNVYHAYKGFGAQPIIPTDDHEEPQLATNVESFLQELVSFFGRYTGIQLSNATHNEEPWCKARDGIGRRDPSTVQIPRETMRKYYLALIIDGEEALSRHEMLATVPEPRWAWLYASGICARMMVKHPLYSWALVKKLSEPVPAAPELPAEFYTPIRNREILNLGDISSLTTEEIAARVTDAIGTP